MQKVTTEGTGKRINIIFVLFLITIHESIIISKIEALFFFKKGGKLSAETYFT